MFNLVMSAVENAVTNVRNEITGSIGERGAGSEKDYAQHRALLQELCVTCPPLCINAGSTGEIRFNRFFSPDVCACLQTRESELAEALEPVRAIAKFHGGFFGWDIGREGGFTAVLRLPVIVNDPALEEEGDYAIKAVDSRAAIVRSIEDRIMGHILLERSYTTSGGKIKKYEIKTDGAALMSAEAYSRFSSALDYADLLTEIVPELDRLEFSAYGTAGNIADAYQTGCFSVVFAGPFRAPERITLGILGLQLAWEEDKTEAGEAEKKGRGISFDDTERFLKGVRLLRFDEGLFGNKELLAMIGEVCRRAEPVQLSLDFDIEAQKLILPDLCRVLDEVQALHPGERLGLHLCRIDYVDGACGDAILSLQVLDRTGGIIAKGSLSRTTKSFAYGTHDPVLTSRAEDRIIAAVKSAQAQGEITFRKLDRKLEENGLELPEDLVMDLVKESARFAAMEEPDAALAWYVDMRLNRQELQTTEEGGRIKVTKPVS